MGQALLPAHLRAQEESMLADSALRFSLQEAPAYGLYSLLWNENLLSDGVLSLEEMTLVMYSGLLLKLKENAQITVPLDLNISGGNLLPVYLHVRSLPENSSPHDAGRQSIKRDNVSCWLWSLELTTEQENPDTVESFRLAEFEKQPDSSWRLSSRYIPPLARLGSMPFLKQDLAGLVQKLEAYHYQLTQEIAAIYLSGSDLVNARQCLKSVVQIQRFLANLLAEISPHPYTVYEQLKRFYVDLCFYHDNSPQSAAAPYRHEHLAELFRETFELLHEQLQLSQMRSPYLPFAQSGGIIRANLPEPIRKAKEIYLLVQKGTIAKTVSLESLKIAAVTRIAIVHKFFLQGIPFKRIDRPPFQHSFGPEVDIYQLSPGDEWDHALKELALCFYADPKFTEEKFFLHWRTV